MQVLLQCSFYLLYRIFIRHTQFDSPSKRDRLSVPARGRTPLRRNTTYGLCVWRRVPYPSRDFLSFLFLANYYFLLMSRSTCSHFLFLQHLLLFPVLPNCFVPYFFSQNALEHARSRSLLQRTSPHSSTLSSHVLPFSSAFSYPVLPFVPILSLFVRTFSSHNPLEHARSRSLLQRTSPPSSVLRLSSPWFS